MSDTDNRKRQQTFSKMAAEPPSLVIRLNTFDINILNINSANSRLSISSSTWTTSSKYVKKTAKLAQRLTVGAAILNYSFTNRWHLQAKLLFIQRVPSPSKLVNKLHPQQCVCLVIKPAQIAIKGTVHQKTVVCCWAFGDIGCRDVWYSLKYNGVWWHSAFWCLKRQKHTFTAASLPRNHHRGTQDSLQTLLRAVFLFSVEVTTRKRA